jgi:DNA repair photolyase
VVSKPNIESVRRICIDFDQFRDLLLFRFTITARDSRILEFWEPKAPDYAERKSCLEYAFDEGFETSVSVEPMLDTTDVVSMVRELLPYISHSIWLGKMNRIDERVKIDSEQMRLEIERIRQGQRDEKLWQLYRALKPCDKVRWKESVKEVLGIKAPSEPGLDI